MGIYIYSKRINWFISFVMLCISICLANVCYCSPTGEYQEKYQKDIKEIQKELEEIKISLKEIQDEIIYDRIAYKTVTLMGVMSLIGAVILFLAKMNIEYNNNIQNFDGL